MRSFAREFPRRHDDHPLPGPPACDGGFARQVASRPARVLFGDGDFAAQRRELVRLGACPRVYRIHALGGHEWRLYEVPSGRELVVTLARPPRRAKTLETWYERTPTGWVGKYR